MPDRGVYRAFARKELLEATVDLLKSEDAREQPETTEMLRRAQRRAWDRYKLVMEPDRPEE